MSLYSLFLDTRHTVYYKRICLNVIYKTIAKSKYFRRIQTIMMNKVSPFCYLTSVFDEKVCAKTINSLLHNKAKLLHQHRATLLFAKRKPKPANTRRRNNNNLHAKKTPRERIYYIFGENVVLGTC